MADGGMHASFNGLSSIREFSVAEVTAHLAALCDVEQKHLGRIKREFQRANSVNKVQGILDNSQRLFVGLIENKVERYQAAVEALDTLAKNADTVTLDISRELASQILELAPKGSDAKEVAAKTTPK